MKKAKKDLIDWEGLDEGLFERLRELRKELALERGVPPYLIFGDRTLRELAATKPKSTEAFAEVHGVGKKKLAGLGPIFLAAIAYHEDPAAAPEE